MSTLPELNLKSINQSSTINSSRASLRRHGNTYIIKNTEAKEDVDDLYHLVTVLYDETVTQSRWADFKATLYKIGYIIGSIFITIAGAVIGVLGLMIGSNHIAVIFLGFSISVVKSLLSLFALEKRSYLLKDASIKLKKLSRDTNELKTQIISPDELIAKMNRIYNDMDDLDIYMFSNGNNNKIVTNNKSDTTITI
ncbi:MAG TPA: hypothetical protein VLG50_05595 [Candidatus Saccharimonadales bacterium]|nr:hypothetical protein [Candidatus Saccharimonadales bacterium]